MRSVESTAWPYDPDNGHVDFTVFATDGRAGAPARAQICDPPEFGA